MSREYVDIIDLVIDEKYWVPEAGDHYKTGHCYLGSPIETYDSCDNCDGALCEKCKTVTRGLRWEFCINVIDLENKLVEKGVPREEARDLATCDGSYTPDTNFRLSDPTEYQLKEDYSDFYKKINEIDDDVIKAIDFVIEDSHPTIYADLQDKVFEFFHLVDKFHGHIPNQMKLYWIRCKKNHKIACKIKEE